MSDPRTRLYDDGSISCDDEGLVIRRYYLWGAKQIPYTAVRGIKELSLSGRYAVRRWRIWGSGDLIHWWNLDLNRPHKRLALVLDLGRRVRPTITPDDPAAVASIIRGRL